MHTSSPKNRVKEKWARRVSARLRAYDIAHKDVVVLEHLQSPYLFTWAALFHTAEASQAHAEFFGETVQLYYGYIHVEPRIELRGACVDVTIFDPRLTFVRAPTFAKLWGLHSRYANHYNTRGLLTEYPVVETPLGRRHGMII